ncbi:MAG: phosphoserine phosphatase [Lasallia pustulata]|uniref:phosphoserine phosphatase n=1 Tax=Lasallia pustulata TaxID=136370 RepID=A0A5M8PH87_9LECA|nr:MAG: phosphoserine phosphatase [Lasallia pustulata]
MAVVSGGFAPMAEWLAGKLGLDYVVANHLLTDTTTHPPTLSGLLSPTHPIIDGTQKQLLLHSIAASNNIPLSATMAVGDGANDLLMLHAAGLGVAFRAKEKVQREVCGFLRVGFA